MPFESGNKLGGRPSQKEFRDALNLALKDASNDKRSLRKVAEALVDEAVDGNVAAIKEIADRLDGKVPQGITGPDGEGPVALAISWQPLAK